MCVDFFLVVVHLPLFNSRRFAAILVGILSIPTEEALNQIAQKEDFPQLLGQCLKNTFSQVLGPLVSLMRDYDMAGV